MSKYGYCENCGSIMERVGCTNCDELDVIEMIDNMNADYREDNELMTMPIQDELRNNLSRIITDGLRITELSEWDADYADAFNELLDSGAQFIEAYKDNACRELLDSKFITTYTEQKVKESSFPFAETYDFLYSNHKDVLEELEAHLEILNHSHETSKS